MKTGKLFLILAIAAAAAGAAMPAVSFWIFTELAQRSEISLEGKFRPSWFDTAFAVEDMRLRWEGRLEVKGDRIRVRYDLRSLFSEEGLIVLIKGRGLPVRLLGEWRERAEFSETTFEFAEAHLRIGKDGVRDILKLEAKSADMEFQLGIK